MADQRSVVIDNLPANGRHRTKTIGFGPDGKLYLNVGSFNDDGARKLVVVVLLTGGRAVSGPQAAGIAGEFYRRIGEKNNFKIAQTVTPAATTPVQSTMMPAILMPSLLSGPSWNSR